MVGLTEKELIRLNVSIRASYTKLRPFREYRVDRLKHFVGPYFGDDGVGKRQYINFLELAVSIYTRLLAAKTPKVMITTPHQALKPFSIKLKLAVDHLLDEIQFINTLREVVMNAMFDIGVVKLGLNRSASVELGGYYHDIGQPYCDAVHLDDFFWDVTARKYEEVQYVGNKYRLTMNEIKNAGLYDPDVVSLIQPTSQGGESLFGSGSDDRFPEDKNTLDEEFDQSAELVDVWLPKRGLFLTLSLQESLPPLAQHEWDGPESGPYEILGFGDVPGSIMPLAPASLWFDMHTLTSSMFRKFAAQAQRQKTILAVQRDAVDDATKTLKAVDGEAVPMDQPGSAKELRYGGIDAATLAFFIQTKDLFSWAAGNLDTLGGLSTSAETLGQEQLMAATSSKRVADMQDRVINFTKRVVKQLAWYLWTDPMIKIPLVKPIPGADLALHFELTAEQLEGDFLDYNIGIHPFSATHQTPASKIQTMDFLLEKLLGPFAPVLMQQGYVPNAEAIVRFYSEMTDTPELNEILTKLTPSQRQMSESDRGPVTSGSMGKPASTTRNYVRRNVPGVTRAGKDTSMIQSLLGQNQQPAEAARSGSMS